MRKSHVSENAVGPWLHWALDVAQSDDITGRLAKLPTHAMMPSPTAPLAHTVRALQDRTRVLHDPGKVSLFTAGFRKVSAPRVPAFWCAIPHFFSYIYIE